MRNSRVILLFALAFAVFYANLGGFSIYILDEAKNAGCAMEMYTQQEWIVPTFNGELRTDKPPLHYYFMRLAYAVGGVSAGTARFFSAFMGVGLILGLYGWICRLIDERTGFYAALITLASLQLGFQFHLAVPDPYLLFFLTMGWLSWIYAWSQGKPRAYYLAYGCLALATLAKGPLAPFLSLLVLGLFLLFERQISWATFRRIRIFSGALLYLFLVAPWYVLVTLETEGQWLQDFIFKHNVSRFTEPMEGHGGFPGQSIVIAFAGLIPFTLLLPLRFRMLKDRWKSDSIFRFITLAAGVVVVFFAFSRTILPTYPEPAYPFLAIVLAMVVCSLESNASRWVWIPGLLFLMMAVAIAGLVPGALENAGYPQTAQLSFGLWLLPVFALAAVFLIKKRFIYAFWLYIIGNILTLLFIFWVLLPDIDSHNPVTRAITALKLQETQVPVISYRIFNPAFQFNLQRPLPNAADTTELDLMLDSGQEVLLVTRKKYLRDLETFQPEILFEQRDLFEKHVTVVLKIKGQAVE